MAKKMILMDPRWLESLKPTPAYTPPDDNIRDLDSQMKQILDRDDLAGWDKANQRTLQRYMQCLDQYQSRPLGHVDIKSPSSTLESVHKEPVTEKNPTMPSTGGEPAEKAGVKEKYKLTERRPKLLTPVKWDA